MERFNPSEEQIPSLSEHREALVEDLEKFYDDHEKKAHQLIIKTFKVLTQDTNTKWERGDTSSLKGSFAEKHSKKYKAQIDSKHILTLDWREGPPLDKIIKDSSAFEKPEEFIEMYSIGIEFKREKLESIPDAIRQLSFEKIGFTTDKEGNPEPNENLKYFPENIQEQIQYQIIELGKQLREKLG